MIAPGTAGALVEALRAVIRAGRAVQQARLDGERLPGSLMGLLHLLDREGEQRISRLAEHLSVDPSVVSRQAVVLERLGLASRRPDPGDGRAHLLAVTAEGRAALERYRARWVEWLVDALAEWDDDDAQEVLAHLHRLLRDVQRIRPRRSGETVGATPALAG